MKKYFFWGMFFLFVSLTIIGLVVANNLTDNHDPTPVDLQRQTNALQMSRFWGALAPWVVGGLIIGVIILFVIIVGPLARWLKNRANQINADKGVLPVQMLSPWSWVRVARWLWLPRQLAIFHDANRAAGPTTIYLPRVDGTVEVQQVHGENVPPEQIQITKGAQVVQAASAMASGESRAHPMRQQLGRGRMPQISVINDYAGISRPPMISPGLPPVEVIEGGHLQRLLEEQGTLPNAPQMRIPEEGEPTI